MEELEKMIKVLACGLTCYAFYVLISEFEQIITLHSHIVLCCYPQLACVQGSYSSEWSLERYWI